ncbi:MAG: hypothetical protein K0S49_1768 [Microbacterium sp.]|jgi:hypothetical protein|nr:hypothetical protein [Microbacterium sp.]
MSPPSRATSPLWPRRFHVKHLAPTCVFGRASAAVLSVGDAGGGTCVGGTGRRDQARGRHIRPVSIGTGAHDPLSHLPLVPRRGSRPPDLWWLQDGAPASPPSRATGPTLATRKVFHVKHPSAAALRWPRWAQWLLSVVSRQKPEAERRRATRAQNQDGTPSQHIRSVSTHTGPHHPSRCLLPAACLRTGSDLRMSPRHVVAGWGTVSPPVVHRRCGCYRSSVRGGSGSGKCPSSDRKPEPGRGRRHVGPIPYASTAEGAHHPPRALLPFYDERGVRALAWLSQDGSAVSRPELHHRPTLATPECFT